ncbi:MAG: hypothetical protein LBI05_11220, partial [Planctomycetaceae bacterium]|nr:hypothetical protein [Planctomycetaceae bacterium]
FRPKLEKIFLVPSHSFDNVNGKFPIGFKIWNTSQKKEFKRIKADVFDVNGKYLCKKTLYTFSKQQYINNWVSLFKATGNDVIGYLAGINGNGFQNTNIVYILNSREQLANPRGTWINQYNLIPASIYFAVRKVIPADWLNDRDQFLYPNDGWKADKEFRNDCLTYTLFHGSNNIQSRHGVNHWIPFTESEVNARSKFKSNFMTDFIAGKIEYASDLFTNGKKRKKFVFSAEAKAVFTAGKKLWTYYHAQPKCNVNASLYDIREHFQGRNTSGKMNNKSTDETYNSLIADLRSALKTLAEKIEPKVYEYGFLKK